MQPDTRPIGILDSGVGGLSVLREVQRQLAGEDVLYFADQGHVPYGPRDKQEIRAFARGMVRFFLARKAKLIVVACNAASAAALYHLRETFPQTVFVGMEPAVKPAAERTQARVIGVLTTKATYQGELFATVVDRFAHDVEVVTQVCPDLVTLVEAGELDTPGTREAVRAYLAPLLEAGVDQLVLGCTHFPFLAPVICSIAGDAITIVDPGPAIARQAGRMIARQRNRADHPGHTSFFTSADPGRLHALAQQLLGQPVPRESIVGVRWVDAEVEC